MPTLHHLLHPSLPSLAVQQYILAAQKHLLKKAVTNDFNLRQQKNKPIISSSQGGNFKMPGFVTNSTQLLKVRCFL